MRVRCQRLRAGSVNTKGGSQTSRPRCTRRVTKWPTEPESDRDAVRSAASCCTRERDRERADVVQVQVADRVAGRRSERRWVTRNVAGPQPKIVQGSGRILLDCRAPGNQLGVVEQVVDVELHPRTR